LGFLKQLLRELERGRLPDLVLLGLFYKREDVDSEQQKEVDKKLRELEDEIEKFSEIVRPARDALGLRILEDIRRSASKRPELEQLPVLLYTRRGISLLKDEEIRKVISNQGEWMIKNSVAGKGQISSYTENVCINRVIERSSEFDVCQYMQKVKTELPEVLQNEELLDYLAEAKRAFGARCFHAASVLLGVALEHTTLLLMESVKSSEYEKSFNGVRWDDEYTSTKVGKFWSEFMKNKSYRNLLPPDVRENLETELTKIREIIWYNRNTSAHANSRKISCELCESPFELFIACARKMFDLKQYYDSKPG
jgi:hypothetical protein